MTISARCGEATTSKVSRRGHSQQEFVLPVQLELLHGSGGKSPSRLNDKGIPYCLEDQREQNKHNIEIIVGYVLDLMYEPHRRNNKNRKTAYSKFWTACITEECSNWMNTRGKKLSLYDVIPTGTGTFYMAAWSTLWENGIATHLE